eukprot:TRINITY_DN80663_c0_g1_i1.p1 TRINITY_DN80663_c0_g1~~TRINITY_DN80663_c0_g1_i1.p1  ORF type:complete len:118 (-),score=6.39 TRINITY_DN80663_c0_g1_i1:512-865(-)
MEPSKLVNAVNGGLDVCPFFPIEEHLFVMFCSAWVSIGTHCLARVIKISWPGRRWRFACDWSQVPNIVLQVVHQGLWRQSVSMQRCREVDALVTLGVWPVPVSWPIQTSSLISVCEP